jgi:hypothetical protein
MINLEEIINANGGKVDFTESLTVKLSPHTPPRKIRSVSIERVLKCETKEGEVLEVNSKDTTLVNSIYQRLQILRHQKIII